MSFLIALLFALNIRKIFAPEKPKTPASHYLVGLLTLIVVLNLLY